MGDWSVGSGYKVHLKPENNKDTAPALFVAEESTPTRNSIFVIASKRVVGVDLYLAAATMSRLPKGLSQLATGSWEPTGWPGLCVQRAKSYGYRQPHPTMKGFDSLPSVHLFPADAK
jgi:hypothetical protein